MPPLPTTIAATLHSLMQHGFWVKKGEGVATFQWMEKKVVWSCCLDDHAGDGERRKFFCGFLKLPPPTPPAPPISPRAKQHKALQEVAAKKWGGRRRRARSFSLDYWWGSVFGLNLRQSRTVAITTSSAMDSFDAAVNIVMMVAKEPSLNIE